MKQVIILAAGLGSRMREVTKVLPKSLIPINGQPILERNIEFIIEEKFKRIILIVGYMHWKFDYLKEKYAGQIEIILVFNPKFREYNTLSSMYYACSYFNMDSYVVTGDLYLVNNIYKKYQSMHNFYLHRMVKELDKPEWIAELSEKGCIISVDKNGYTGSSYTGVSFWTVKDLKFIKRKLAEIDWNISEIRNMFWDEIFFPEFKSYPVYVKHCKNNEDIFEIDDLNDVRKLKLLTGDPETVEMLEKQVSTSMFTKYD